MGTHTTSADPVLDTVADLDLVELTRAGDRNAFAELWRRHSVAGRAVARSYARDPDDVLAESFARILTAIKAGGGPTTAFRAYLFTTIRSVAFQSRRGPATDTVDDFDALVDIDSEEAATLEALDRSLTAQAFKSLPTRWQEALWYSEVEQLTSAEIAPLLGMKPNAVNALTFRAREGLRQAWIQVHLSRSKDSECAAIIERLGSYTRGTLGPRETRRVEQHLLVCQSCQIVAEEAREVSSKLALVLLPLSAGLVGATGYSAWLQTGTHEGATAMARQADDLAALHGGAGPGARVAGMSTSGSSSVSLAVAALTVAAAVVTGIVMLPVSLLQAPAQIADAADREITPVAERGTSIAPPAVPIAPPAVPTPAPPADPADPQPTVPRPPAESPRTVPPSAAPSAPESTTPTPVVSVPAPLPEAPAEPTNPEPPVPPGAPDVVISADPAGLYLPLITGTGSPGATIQAISSDGTLLGEAVAEDTGRFAFDDLPALTFGLTSVGVRQIAADGTPSPVTPYQDVTMNDIRVESPTPGETVSAPGFALVASGVPGATVLVVSDVASLARESVTIDSGGDFSSDVNLAVDQTGTLTVTMRYVDDDALRFGPPLSVTFTVVPPVP